MHPLRIAALAAVLCALTPLHAMAQSQSTSASQDATCIKGTPPCLRAPVLAAPVARTPGTVDWVSSLPSGGLAVGIMPMSYSGSASATVATSSGTLFAAGAYQRTVLICTLPASTANVWLRLDGSTAVVNTGVVVYAGGGCTAIGASAMPIPTSSVTAITDGVSAQTVTLAGG